MPAGKTCCDKDIPSNCCRSLSWWNVDPVNSPDAMILTKPYDGLSAMHFSDTDGAKEGTKTITAIAPGVVLRNSRSDASQKATALDAQGVCLLYKDACNNRKAACKKEKCLESCLSEGSKTCQERKEKCAPLKCTFMRLLA